MPWIDFKRLLEFLRYGDDQSSQQGFAALCHIQQNEMLGGQWGLKRILLWMKSEGHEPKEIDIRALPNEILDKEMISRRPARAFEVDSAHGEQSATMLAKKICGTLHPGRRILITIPDCEQTTDETWQWLLHEFWGA